MTPRVMYKLMLHKKSFGTYCKDEVSARVHTRLCSSNINTNVTAGAIRQHLLSYTKPQCGRWFNQRSSQLDGGSTLDLRKCLTFLTGFYKDRAWGNILKAKHI